MRLLRSVHQLLGTDPYGIRLIQCDLWGKRGSTDVTFAKYCNSNQRIHCDYPNHTIVVPPDWSNPEVVSIIIYFDNSSEVSGETRVVARHGSDDPAYHAEDMNPLLLTPGARGDILWVNDRAHAEAYLVEEFPEVHKFREQHLYPREAKVGFEVGSVLFYRHDIWHRYTQRLHFIHSWIISFNGINRGTPLLPGATRRTQNIAYKREGCDWVGNWSNGPARRMYETNQVQRY